MPDTVGPTGLAATLQLAAACGALLCLIAAAIEDGWRYRISNPLVVGVAACFALYAAAEASWVYLGWSLAAMVVVLAVASVAFMFGVFGGGDTKMIAAMALWTQFHGLPGFALVMSAFGGLLGVIWLIRRRMNRSRATESPAAQASTATSPRQRPGQAPDEIPGQVSAPAKNGDDDDVSEKPRGAYSHLPYGIAIALAGIYFFLFSPTSPLLPWLPY